MQEHGNDPEDEQKYVVFKKEDWERFVGAPDLIEFERQRLVDSEVDGCVVIRHQDVFAATAFYEYASNIRTALEILDLTDAAYDASTNKRLLNLADFFVRQGDRAALTKSKIPD